MSVMTLEGIVEKGQIRLIDGASLPEKARVYVVVPEAPQMSSPRLADPRQIEKLPVEEMESEALEEQTAAGGGSLIGLFADEPELIDEVCRLALEDRASQGGRLSLDTRHLAEPVSQPDGCQAPPAARTRSAASASGSPAVRTST